MGIIYQQFRNNTGFWFELFDIWIIPIIMIWSSLCHREEHRKLHKLHEGHEEMHAAMIIIFFVILVVSQIALVQWKQRHFHSYQMATLAAMWIIPVVISLRNGYWRFIGFWVLFSVITGLVAKKVTQSPIERTTPR